jgi:ferredoxin
MKIRIEPAGFEFYADTDTPVLLAAEAAGIDMPSSCRNGTCRTCICQMTSGEIRYTTLWPGVSPDEKDEGWILPCVAEPVGNVTLRVPYAKSVF